MANNSTHESRLTAALAALESQMPPMYRRTASEFKINHTTLRRRFLGLQLSRSEAVSETHKRLTNIQEEVLIKHINDLSNRGIFPTTQIVKNLAEEIIQDSLGKNWVGNFVCRKKDKLKSLYLRNIDNMRIKADYVPNFKLFYDQVCFNLSFILIYTSMADKE
jgi:hypothetical protein